MVTIRRARHADAAGIITAHVRSIREVCSRDYRPEEIAAWSGRNFKEHIWHEAMDRDIVWVLDADKSIQGFGHLRFKPERRADIAGLYFVPEAIGQGFGRRLMSLIYDALEDQGVERAIVQATVNAEGFYRAMGFQAVQRATHEVDGVPIDCIDMEKHAPFRSIEKVS